MLARSKLISQKVSTRNFQTSARSFNNIFGSPKTGVYSNIPFKVKNRKIPISFWFWGVTGSLFAFPFVSTYWHLKKSGSFME